jgi:DNA-binding MarR family transcriptional regulator
MTTKTDTSMGGLESALHLLHRAGQKADEIFAINVGGSDITPRQFAVLKAIAVSGDPSQTDLVERTGIDRSTMADIVRRLLARGLVQRRRTRRDARMYAVKLTEKGRQTLDQAEPAVRTTDERILERLSASQRESFLRALARIVEAMDTAVPKGEPAP